MREGPGQLLFHEKATDERGNLYEASIWKVPASLKYPDGVRYRLAFIRFVDRLNSDRQRVVHCSPPLIRPTSFRNSRDQILHFHEAVDRFDASHVPVVAFRMVVVIKHDWPAFSETDEGRTVADAVRVLQAGRNLPYRGFIEVSPLVCRLLVKRGAAPALLAPTSSHTVY